MAPKTSVRVLPPPRHPVRELTAWAAGSCPEGAAVLSVGAGADVSGGMQPLLRRRPILVGVDPDQAIERNGTLAERHRMSVEAYADTHADAFDLVVSTYVFEHVANPSEFATAIARVLRPGGRWFALTLNVRHYFGATTWALSRLHVAEPVLHRLKGQELVHEHHFPTVYRFNSRSTVLRECGAAGFDRVDFRYFDAPDRYAWYLPRQLQWFPPAYTRAAYRIGSPQLMGHLAFRATKADRGGSIA